VQETVGSFGVKVSEITFPHPACSVTFVLNCDPWDWKFSWLPYLFFDMIYLLCREHPLHY
jgi:hypothetical protein